MLKNSKSQVQELAYKILDYLHYKRNERLKRSQFLQLQQHVRNYQKMHQDPTTQADAEAFMLRLLQILNRSIQNQLMLKRFYDGSGREPYELYQLAKLMGISDRLYCEHSHNRPAEKWEYIDLNTQTVWALVWKMGKGDTGLIDIGRNRPCGRFMQSANHDVKWIEELHVGQVATSGNHSVTSGTLDGFGTVMPRTVVSIQPLMQALYFDGSHFRFVHNRVKAGRPMYPEVGYTFYVATALFNMKKGGYHG